VDGAAAFMSKTVKSDGRFVVEFGGKGNVQRIVQATLEPMNRPSMADRPWYFPSVGEYSSILEIHGMEVISATLYDGPTLFEEGEEGLSIGHACLEVHSFETCPINRWTTFYRLLTTDCDSACRMESNGMLTSGAFAPLAL
jgi:hypothetical protein